MASKVRREDGSNGGFQQQQQKQLGVISSRSMDNDFGITSRSFAQNKQMYFDNTTDTEVTTLAGNTTLFYCTVYNLGSYQVHISVFLRC